MTPQEVGTFVGACSRAIRRNSMTARSISSVSTEEMKGGDRMNLPIRREGPSTFGYLSEPLNRAESWVGPMRETDTPQGNVTSVKEELAPHVSDITRVLGNKVSEQEIERELSSYLNVYRVSLDTAKRSIV